MYLKKNLTVFTCILLPLASQGMNGTLTSKLKELKLKIDEFGVVIAPRGKVPEGLERKYPNLTADQLRLLEKLLGSEAVVKRLSALSEEEILKLIEDLMTNPEFGGTGETQGESEGGEIPPPPGEDDEGDIPPPPGEGMPSEQEAKKKDRGLSDQEMAQLSSDSKEASDSELISILTKLAFASTDGFARYANAIERNFTSLGSTKTSAFKFKQGNDPKNLAQELKNFVTNQLFVPTDSSAEKLKNIAGLINDKNKIQQFLDLFKPWVLGSFEAFNTAAATLVPSLFINIGAAIRKEMPPIYPMEIDPDSDEAAYSDKKFLDAFGKSSTYDDLLRNLNLLRLNTNYLKVDALEEDLASAQRKPGIKEGPMGQAEDIRKALEREIRERAQRQEVRTGKDSLFQALKDGRNVQEVVNKVDVGRYLFYVPSFEKYKKNLEKFLKGAHEEKKEPKKKDIPQITLVEYLERAIAQAREINDVFDAMRAILRANKVDESTILLPLQEGSKKISYYITFDPTIMKNLESNKNIQMLTLARKEPFRLDHQKAIVDVLKNVGGGLNVQAQMALTDLFDRSMAAFQLNNEVVVFLSKIENPTGMQANEKRLFVAALYSELSRLEKDKRYMFAQDRLAKLKNVLISVNRTKKDVEAEIKPFIVNLSPESQTKILASLAIIEPYGSLAKLFDTFAQKMDSAKTYQERVRLLNDLIEFLKELNEKNSVSDADLSRQLQLGVLSRESYQNKLTPMFALIDEGNIPALMQFLEKNFFDAGKEVAQNVKREDVVAHFNALEKKIRNVFVHMIYAHLLSHLQAIKDKKSEIASIKRESNENVRLVYVEFTKLSGELINALNNLNIDDFGKMQLTQVDSALNSFISKWQTGSMKALANAGVEKETIDEIVRKIDAYGIELRKRFNYLAKE